ncbi:MAG TPA: TIGR00730 family Rossman fold protein [Gemmataceae bacterium]|nr:TIGR00730 family Rossman fold protein [Gemmataceae bacterium]
MKRLCVFCGSSVGGRETYVETTRRLGETMVRHGLGLVFGAGHIGLMGVLADAVLAAGGEAIGVIPQALVDRELAHERLTQLHVVDTMHQRKALMADLADAFVALPGGYGTADELFEILTWAQLGLHQKPIGLLNIRGFFDPLIAWVDHCVREGFIRPQYRDLLAISTESGHLLDLLSRREPAPQMPKWIGEKDR